MEQQNKITKMLEEKKKKLAENNVKIAGLNEQNAKLDEEIHGLEEQMAKMVKMKQNEKSGQKRKLSDGISIGSNSGKKFPKTSIKRHPLPAELMNELFGGMPFANAFCLLAKMPNGLLARNVQKMANGINMAMKSNKWNEDDCGPMLAISGDGLIVTHIGGRCNSVRAIMPIPPLNLTTKKPSIAFYYEVQIRPSMRNLIFYSIGFCCEDFLLKLKWPGNVNSIGFGNYNRKGGIWIDGNRTKIRERNIWANYFRSGNVVGIGIIHSQANSLKCFVTGNGTLLGMSELPTKFTTLKLFPTISLGTADQSIRVNFGKEKWRFKDFKHVLEYNNPKNSRLNQAYRN